MPIANISQCRSYSADNSAICSAGNHVGHNMVLICTRSRFLRGRDNGVYAYSRREYPRARKNVLREGSIGRATERERESRSRGCALPRRDASRLSAMSARRLSALDACRPRTSHVSCCLVCLRVWIVFFSLASVCAKIVCARINMPSFCLPARINTVNIKCRKCLISVVNAIKCECLFAVSRIIVFLPRPLRDIKLKVVSVCDHERACILCLELYAMFLVYRELGPILIKPR